MRYPTAYLKMRVLGAIENALGDSIAARIKSVSQMTFTDEDGAPRSVVIGRVHAWEGFGQGGADQGAEIRFCREEIRFGSHPAGKKA